MKELLLTGRGPNTMTRESLDAMREFLHDNREAPILIRGEGAAFSAGLDLDSLIDEDPRAIAAAIEAAAEALFTHPAPTVAAVNGHAIAGGCLLLQACDLRICTRDPATRIGMPGVALGINYPPKLLRILRYRVPAGALEQVLLGAQNHTPEQALSLGLVDRLEAEPVTAARDALARLAAHPPAAYAATKRARRAGQMDISDDERRVYEAAFEQHWTAANLRANRRDKR